MADPEARTRTPPDIKWLLNERAALAGEVAKSQARQEALSARLLSIQNQMAGIVDALERSRLNESRHQASLTALDATMKLINTQLNEQAGGTIQAWAGKYGQRGGLGAFVAQMLQMAQPEPLTTTVMMNLAIRHFGLVHETSLDRRNFNKSVSSSLRVLHQRGLIEPLYARTEGSRGLWRWKAPTATLDALRARADQTFCPKNGEELRTWL